MMKHFSSKKQKKSYQAATLFVHSGLVMGFCKKNQPTTNPISPHRIGYILRWGDMGLVGKMIWVSWKKDMGVYSFTTLSE